MVLWALLLVNIQFQHKITSLHFKFYITLAVDVVPGVARRVLKKKKKKKSYDFLKKNSLIFVSLCYPCVLLKNFIQFGSAVWPAFLANIDTYIYTLYIRIYIYERRALLDRYNDWLWSSWGVQRQSYRRFGVWRRLGKYSRLLLLFQYNRMHNVNKIFYLQSDILHLNKLHLYLHWRLLNAEFVVYDFKFRSNCWWIKI